MKVNLSYCTEGGEQQEKLALLMQAGIEPAWSYCGDHR